jgi:hypothetical protein
MSGPRADMSGLSTLSGSVVGFQRGGSGISGLHPGHVQVFGTPTALLVVQEKLDYPVSETGLSSDF